MKYQIAYELEFRKNPYPGRYISLEGIDGCGKTTQVKKLKEHFEAQGKEVVVTSEPRLDLFGGDDIYTVFQSKKKISGIALQYLLTANRVINHDEIVYPALEAGKVVITDRCFWSAVPYGLMDRGVDFNKQDADLMLVTQGLLSQYHQFIVPDSIFYLDVSIETAMERLLTRKNRANDIYEKKEKLEKVISGYRWLTTQYAEHFVVLHGDQSIDQVTKELIRSLEFIVQN
jgi:dTMP kinase